MKNGELKIEKGIPIPTQSRVGRGPSEFTHTLATMKKGDSLFMPNETGARIGRRVSSYALANKLRGHYVCRTMDGGVRIWRTK